MKSRGQSAIEFMILIGAILFFFMAFALAIQYNLLDKTNEKKDVLVREVALTVQDEINLAKESIDGYGREFKLPEKLLDDGYEVSIVAGAVYVVTYDEKHATAYPVADVFGQPLKGINTIRKAEGQVYLNS